MSHHSQCSMPQATAMQYCSILGSNFSTHYWKRSQTWPHSLCTAPNYLLIAFYLLSTCLQFATFLLVCNPQHKRTGSKCLLRLRPPPKKNKTKNKKSYFMLQESSWLLKSQLNSNWPSFAVSSSLTLLSGNLLSNWDFFSFALDASSCKVSFTSFKSS